MGSRNSHECEKTMNIILVASFFTLAIMATLFFAVVTLKQYSKSAMQNIAAYNAPQKTKRVKVSVSRNERVGMNKPSPRNAQNGYVMSKLDIKNVTAANLDSAICTANITAPPQAA